ncbi:CHAD domain-containing protein [Nocardia uniformis]|uniref:CHAD domain-containing protein n=1 Tax=Nocardia uniformis TaxID=53432 RepID=A0A849C0W1_9NOCA|nr:CHAD domain-containing protein [Nocardia uniformis]NNH72403.1 CHAD domain-containing protein [Nocardia uniformis]
MTHTAAGPALVAAIADDVDRLLSAEPDVRQDLPDSVHQMRVATRRLRSVLRSYSRIFEQRPIDELRDELRWLAGLLGVARDAEVRAERFEALLDRHPELAPKKSRARGESGTRRAKPARRDGHGPPGRKSATGKRVSRTAEVTAIDGGSTSRIDLRGRLLTAERDAYASAHAEIMEALDSDRYRSLTECLRSLLTDPPLRTKYAERDATKFCDSVLRKDFHRVHRLVHSEPGLPEAERVEHMHEIRKAAKRLRYAADAATGILGDSAKKLSSNAKKLQSVLGDHRDAVEAEAAIRQRSEGSDDPAWQVLCDDEAAAAREVLEQYPAATEFLRDSYSG